MSENPVCPTCEKPGRHYKRDTFVCARCGNSWTVPGWYRCQELMDKRQNCGVTRVLELTFRESFSDQERLCDWCKSPMYDGTRGLHISFGHKCPVFICLKCADSDEAWETQICTSGITLIERHTGPKRCRGCESLCDTGFFVYFSTYRKAFYCKSCLSDISTPRQFEEGDRVKLNGRVAHIAGFNLSSAWPILQFRDDPTRLSFAKDYSIYDLEEV